MACKGCGSENHKEFGAEINIHFPGRAALVNPGVLAFPTLLVCLDCGLTQFSLVEDQLHQLATADRKDSQNF